MSGIIFSLLLKQVELGAFSLAVDLAKEEGWHKVIIEGDAQIIAKALQGKLARSYQTQILVDNITNSTSSVDFISFSFCFREANQVAHCFAK